MFSRSSLFAALAALRAVNVLAVGITDIQGSAFLSPLNGQTVQNVTGIVTAKGSSGFYIQTDLAADASVSSALYVFSSTLVNKTAVGDLVSLGGKVQEYRSSSAYLYATELSAPTNLTVLSSGHTVDPVVLGTDRSPPRYKLSALDTGADGWLSVPNNQSLVSAKNAALRPDTYGLDFWESLEGMLVKVPSPVAINFGNTYGEFWVRGAWNVTGLNARGGLTINYDNSDGKPDANPEVIMVGSPLDGTKNPSVAVGTELSDIVGVIQYQFGFFYILPLTAPAVTSVPDPTVPASNLKTSTDACTVLIGDYNVENMAPTSAHLPTVASQIATYLNTPDIMFLQEIQDNDGPTDDGVVSANLTLSTLAAKIATVSGVNYSFVDIAPTNDQDGGEPGGNIRVAYLYNPAKVSLVPGSPVGGANDSVKVITDSAGALSLNYNPGRIDPASSAWASSRKPLAAAWQTTAGTRFFTVTLQFTAKLGSGSTQSDARPYVNGGVAQRTAQVNSTAAFVSTILAKDPNASVVVGGDMNEYLQTASVFTAFAGILNDLDAAANIEKVERYTYVYDQNTQELDHIFISDAIAARGVKAEHVHLNTWAASSSVQTSDHDPTVAQIKVC